MNPDTERFSLKDHLFNKTKITQLATEIKHVYSKFDADNFIKDCISEFPHLELKARIAHIRTMLHNYLPKDYPQALTIILKALPAPLSNELSDDDFGSFIYAPYNDYVATYGCTREHLNSSLAALFELTQRFSCEDAIRSFLNTFSNETLSELLLWSQSPLYHVRRLCSEGTRPKLPWSQKISINYQDTLPILDNLFYDSTRFVTRSVANHLNDIAKIDPTCVITTLTKWQKSGKQNDNEMEFITKHSLRTLIKLGNQDALALIGHGHAHAIDVSNFSCASKTVRPGESVSFSFTATSPETHSAIIDYIIYFQNKNGEMKSKKIYKLTKVLLEKDTPITISKNHPLRANMTTRSLYPGQHRIEILINGVSYGWQDFTLV